MDEQSYSQLEDPEGEIFEDYSLSSREQVKSPLRYEFDSLNGFVGATTHNRARVFHSGIPQLGQCRLGDRFQAAQSQRGAPPNVGRFVLSQDGDQDGDEVTGIGPHTPEGCGRSPAHSRIRSGTCAWQMAS